MSVLFALIAFVANAGSGIYLRGEVNGWLDGATDELKAQWEFQETADPNVFILTDKLLPAGDFKIGDAEWTDVDFGGTGAAMTSYTSFTVKFNILSGAYSLTKTSSVADVEAVDVKVIGGAGEIRVEGAAEGVKVFALSGALLSEGETIVKVPAGIYLVSVGSKVVKVAVK